MSQRKFDYEIIHREFNRIRRPLLVHRDPSVLCVGLMPSRKTMKTRKKRSQRSRFVPPPLHHVTAALRDDLCADRPLRLRRARSHICPSSRPGKGAEAGGSDIFAKKKRPFTSEPIVQGRRKPTFDDKRTKIARS